MFGRLGSGIVGGISVICTYKYLKEQKDEKKDMAKEIKAQRLENEYLKKKLEKMEDKEVIDDNERREENIEYLNNFDTLMRVMQERQDIREKDFKKIDKKINKTIERNRKQIEKMLKEFDLD